jgi:hypothetical protein
MSLWIIGSSLAIPPILAPHLLGRPISDFRFDVARFGRLLIAFSVIFSLAGFVVNRIST